MKKQSFFILFIMIIGIIMIMRTLFWWNKKEYITTEPNNWLINQLIDSNNIQSENESPNIFSSTWDNLELEDKRITLIMPSYLYTSWWKHFAEDLYNDKKIYINFSFIDNLNSYRDTISNSDSLDADIFLFPYDRNEIFQPRPFTFQQNIQSAFDEMLTPITQKTPTHFLPFSIDPMIMYSSLELNYNDFSTITDTIYNREPEIQSSFPIFFGITNEDLNNKWFKREYQDIVRYALMHYFELYHDSQSLWIWIDSNIVKDSQDTRNYNISDLNNILNTIPSPECKNFPALCFQIYNFAWIRFWFLSDADVVQKYFNQKQYNFTKLHKNALPFSIIESPVRVWWLWINPNLSDTETINSIYLLLVKYMNEHEKYNFRSSTLSPFKQEWHPLYDNPFIWNRWYILYTWWDYINTLKKSDAFKQLMNYKISAEDYLINKP